MLGLARELKLLFEIRTWHKATKCQEMNWRAIWDEFRNWVTLGLQPANVHENPWLRENGRGVER